MNYLKYNTLLLTRILILNIWNLERSNPDNAKGLPAFFTYFKAAAGLESWFFLIDSASIQNRKSIQYMLANHGISSWGWGYNQGNFMFRVKRSQARWAQYLLLNQNVIIVKGLLRTEKSSSTPQNLSRQPDYSQNSSSDEDGSKQITHPPQRNIYDYINSVVDKIAQI